LIVALAIRSVKWMRGTVVVPFAEVKYRWQIVFSVVGGYDGPMTVHTVDRIVCPACSAELAVSDSFCRRCGMPTSLRHVRGNPLALAAARRDPLDSRWVVLGLLMILGPFALPLLYKSRAFRLPMKAVLTVAVLTIAVAAIWLTLYLIGRIVEPLQELWQGAFGGR